jgi:hypothetical protein
VCHDRHKIIPRDHGESLPPDAPAIATVEELRERLQQAVFLEHFTIPPYLCALYSLIDGEQGPNWEVYQIIRSVAMEEMLHMILAANLLSAVGGSPRMTPNGKPDDDFPRYPRLMPHSAIGFHVNLLKFSKEAVNTFLRIERPAERTGGTPPGRFWSIGEFYAAVREALNRLDGEARKKHKNGIFTGDKHRQVTEEHYYGGGGKLLPVYCIEDANHALDEIVGQGEVIDGTIEDSDYAMFSEDAEFAHYFRFNEIFLERRYRPGDRPNDAPTGDRLPVDWDAVYNMVPNPTMAMFKSQPRLHAEMEKFNIIYSKLLRNIQAACNGQPEVLRDGIPLMHAMRNRAVELMNDDSGTGDNAAGPSFEYIP